MQNADQTIQRSTVAQTVWDQFQFARPLGFWTSYYTNVNLENRSGGTNHYSALLFGLKYG